MANPLYTYDPSQVALSLGGVPISGYADGTMIEIERDEDTFTKVNGVGIVSRAKSTSRGGMLRITLQQTSPSNDVLSGFVNADELTGTGVIPMLLKDLSGRSVSFAEHAWIKKPAPQTFAKEISNRVWEVDLADVDVFVAGNAQAT